MTEEQLVRSDRPALHAVEDRSGFDRRGAEQAVAELLIALGRDPSDPHLVETPRRVVDAFAERLRPPVFRATTFPNDEDYADLVLVRDIPFTSLCEHHLLPFSGVAHVGYLPADRLIGLSKLARIVDAVARDLQVQERMTMQIADRLERELRPRGIGVVLAAEHSCMTTRGARATGSQTTTSRFTGALADDERMRARFPGMG